MSTHKLKELAAPRMAKAKEEQNDKLDVMIELLIVDVMDGVRFGSLLDTL